MKSQPPFTRAFPAPHRLGNLVPISFLLVHQRHQGHQLGVGHVRAYLPIGCRITVLSFSGAVLRGSLR